MSTFISGDHLGRFAELDHAVRDEVQVMFEERDPAGSATRAASATRSALHATARALRWFGDWQDRSARSA